MVNDSLAAQIKRMVEIHKFDEGELDARQIVHQNTPQKAVLAAFESLQQRLDSASSDGNYVCLVTSAAPAAVCGGASFIARNLAAMIARDPVKTSMLMDCNIYAPSIDDLLAAQANLGLTDYLAHRETGVEEIVYPSGIPRLRLIPIGEKLEHMVDAQFYKRMRLCLAEVKARYADRYIILDAPSVGDDEAYVRQLAELCDQAVLVVPYAEATAEDVRRASAVLGTRLAGVVLNQQP